MGLNTMREMPFGSGGTPVPGYWWPLAPRPYEGILANIYPTDQVSFASPGRSKIADSPVIIDADICGYFPRWTAQSAAITREIDSGILGGLPRWKGSAHISLNSGLFSTLEQSLTDYSMAVLAKVTTGSRNNSLVSIGPLTTDRIMLYTSTTDKLSIQHNSSDIKAATDSVVIGDWLPIVVSYEAATKAMRVYMGSTTPVISATMTNDPTTSRLAALMTTRENINELDGEMALCVIWNRALHLDSAALASAVLAVNGLAAL